MLLEYRDGIEEILYNDKIFALSIKREKYKITCWRN